MAKSKTVEKAAAQKQKNNGTMVSASFAGPLPPPNLLDSYEQICPGISERLLKTYEMEVAHRHELERAMVDSDIYVQRSSCWQITTGQILAFVICFGFLGAGTFLIHDGFQVAGTIFGGSGLLGIVSAFLSTRKSHNNHNGT